MDTEHPHNTSDKEELPSDKQSETRTPTQSPPKGQSGLEDNITEILPSRSISQQDRLSATLSDHGEKPTFSYHGHRTVLPTESLQRQVYIVWLVLVYAAIFITGWYILVLTSKHPIGRKSYNCFDNDEGSCGISSETLQLQNRRTSWYISKAQTLLSTVALLTIPLTSAVCAAAVVPWLQQSGHGMSLRQIMTLSDKGWTSPYIYYRLLAPTGWKRYGSSFISLALLLHALGAALSPAISQMSSVVTIKVPNSSSSVNYVNKLLTLQDLLQGNLVDDSSTVLRLRSLLKTADLNQIQAQLWVPHNMSCTAQDTLNVPADRLPMETQCNSGGFLTYASLANETEVWQAELGNGFATGIKAGQYLPRVNSSVTVELIDEMPSSCNSQDAALLINYAGSSASTYDGTTVFKWSVQACVVDYPRPPLFNETDDAQTLVETAYLDLYTLNIMDASMRNITKITMSTTVGWFELPNYNNNNLPGPLLQQFSPPASSFNRKERRQSDIPQMPSYVLSQTENASTSFADVPNLELLPKKGPLLNIVYALFGNGSMPSIYMTENATYNTGWSGENNNNPCLDLIPLQTLSTEYSPYNGSDRSSQCLDWWSMAQGNQMHTFLTQFFIPTVALERVFRTAAYMSHSLWFSTTYGSHRIAYDPGQDMQKPGLDNNSIIALSIAITVFLLSLLLLAIYASFSKTWTYSLDAYALLRMGAELGRDALPLLVVKDAHHIGELDELPGWVGDVTVDDTAGVRELGMGYSHLGPREVQPVKIKGKYLSYPRMPRRKLNFDLICHWCNCVCGLGGLRRTKAGSKLRVFAHRCRKWHEMVTERRRKWYYQSKLREPWETFWYGKNPPLPTYSSLRPPQMVSSEV